MEKTWDNFWATGKVEDYLSYKSEICKNSMNSMTDKINISDTTDSIERTNIIERYTHNK